MPLRGESESTDPETWAGFEVALEYAQTGNADGVGFVVTEADPIVGVGLDDGRDPATGEVDSSIGVSKNCIRRVHTKNWSRPSRNESINRGVP